MIMSSSQPKKTSDGWSLPIAKKQPNLNAFPGMPSPTTKDCGSKRPFVDNEPPINARKKSCTTPPMKVTDDPFIDKRKPPSKSVPIGDKKTQKCQQSLSPNLKARIQEDDATTHQTHHQSLSPD